MRTFTSNTIKYLLKRAELNGIGPAASVFVVNDHEGKQDTDRFNEIDRYRRLFRDPDKIRFKQFGFERFCDRGPECLLAPDDYQP